MLLEPKINLKLILNQCFHAFGAKNQFNIDLIHAFGAKNRFKIDLKSIFLCFWRQKSI